MAMRKQVVMLMVGALFFTTPSVFAMWKDNPDVPTKSSATTKYPLPEQPLTAPLPARSGTKVVTPEWLLSLPNLRDNYPVIRWLNNTHLLYASPSRENKKEWSIELLDVRTGTHKLLGEGSDPKPSPDSQWIAFIHGKKETKQLWIMSPNGSNRKQLSHVP